MVLLFDFAAMCSAHAGKNLEKELNSLPQTGALARDHTFCTSAKLPSQECARTLTASTTQTELLAGRDFVTTRLSSQ